MTLKARSVLALAVLFAGCRERTVLYTIAAPRDALSDSPPKPGWSWSTVSRSPWPPDPLEARSIALAEACGHVDGALMRVAARIATTEQPTDRDPDRVARLLRAEGEPHVRPHVVFTEAIGHDDDRLRTALERERAPYSRCGIAIVTAPGGRERIGVVIVDALADLEELPTRARTGQWLTFRAKVHVPITGARVVVLGPRGLPRSVPTSLVQGTVLARFALDRPGEFLVQLVGDREGTGPEPLLETQVFADVEPPTTTPAADPPSDLDLTTAIARARESEALSPLARDKRLDELAQAHADAMRAARRVAHDLGEGDLARRFEVAGLVGTSVGENVAHARSTGAAHEALYRSPSHRKNMLGPFTHFGLGVARDETSRVWVCEVFAQNLR